MLLVRFALLDRAVTIEEVLQTLGGSGGGGGGGRAAAPARVTQVEARATTRSGSVRASLQAPAGVSDLPAQPVLSPPTPPLRVTPSTEQAAVQRDVAPEKLAEGPGWRAELDQAAGSGTRARLTTEAVRQERLAMLRAQDPVLDAAVRELDLDLLD